MFKYTNRYGDVYTFTKQEDGSVLWEGEFEYYRLGFPNVYTEAYQQYRKDGGDMHIQDFEKEVHKYDNVTSEWSEISKKYQSLVYSDTSCVDMVDPSGGPYLNTHLNLGERFDSEELKGLCIQSFECIDTGYKIYTYGEFDHLDD